jgi:hypothetical protein
MLKRSIATLPPGHVIVPWRASLKASVIAPGSWAHRRAISSTERLTLGVPFEVAREE